MKNIIFRSLLAAVMCAAFLTSCSLEMLDKEDNTADNNDYSTDSEVLDEIANEIIFGDDEELTFDEAAEAEEAAAQEEAVKTKTDEINEIIASMTAEEKLAQMFIVSYEQGNSKNAAAEYGFGGFILFADDFETGTVESIRAEMEELKFSSTVTPFLCVDEEGGTVTRISRYTQYRSAKFDSPRDIYASSGIEGIKADTAEKAQLLSSMGLNMNMAPVADISTDESDFMYYRSLGLDPATTSEVVKTIYEESAEYGVASVIKHFPGYGAVTDTHTGMAYDYRTKEELEAYDLIPFADAMDYGISAVMVSHIVTALDWERPASVSTKTVEYIRNDMGYDGILMTDDLSMSGIADFCTDWNMSGCEALEAILAGYDMVICTEWTEQYTVCVDALHNGEISEERLEESVRRILTVKYDVLK